MTDKVALKQKILDVLRYKRQKEEYMEQEQQARKELLEMMQDADMDYLDIGGSEALVEQRHYVDEEKLKENYPEIYMKGATYKFSEPKARESFPRNVVDKAVRQNAERSEAYVKIRRKSKRKKRRGT